MVFKCPKVQRRISIYTMGESVLIVETVQPHIMSRDDFKGIDFWRAPVLKAVHGGFTCTYDKNKY